MHFYLIMKQFLFIYILMRILSIIQHRGSFCFARTIWGKGLAPHIIILVLRGRKKKLWLVWSQKSLGSVCFQKTKINRDIVDAQTNRRSIQGNKQTGPRSPLFMSRTKLPSATVHVSRLCRQSRDSFVDSLKAYWRSVFDLTGVKMRQKRRR